MNRIHLIEFHEQSWVPSILRDCVTDYLRTAMHIGGQYRLIVPLVSSIIEETQTEMVLDLGSGAGGAWPDLLPGVRQSTGRPVRVRLSDQDPNLPAWREHARASRGAIDYVEEAVDARRVSYDGLRTMFNLFHHFRETDARQILADADQQQEPILIIEAMDKSWIQGILIVLLAPIMVLLLTPLIRPFRWGRLVFTYLIPIVPLMVAWDGLVSVIRLYSIESLRGMTSDLAHMNWEAGKIKEKNLVVMYLKGLPASA